MLLEMADDEPLHDRRHRHLAKPRVNPAPRRLGRRQLRQPAAGRRGAVSHAIEQLADRQPAVIADPRKAVGVRRDPPERRGLAGRGRDDRSTSPSQYPSISATWARTSGGPQLDSGSVP